MRIPLWRDLRLSVWVKQNPQAVKVTMPNTVLRPPVRRVLSMRGWMLLLVRYYQPDPGIREVRIRVEAPTDENAGQWAQTIRDLVVAEYGQGMRLEVTISQEGKR